MMARIEKSVEINVPLHTAYSEMTQFRQFPRFMEGVQEVRQIDDTHLHWHSYTDGENREWDSEITEQVPDRCIAWRNMNGPKNNGRVIFEPLDPEKTRITLIMDCEPDGDSPQSHRTESVIAQRTEQDLARFKKMIERQGTESGAWRGEVHGASTEQPAAPAQHGPELHGESIILPGGTQAQRPSSAQPESRMQEERPSADPRQSEVRHAESFQTQHAAQTEASRSPGEQDNWSPKRSGVWEEPIQMVRKMSQEMDHLFERFIGRPLNIPQWPLGAGRNWSPSVEVTRREDRVTVCAELPGIKSGDIHIDIRSDKVIIEGDRHDPQTRRGENTYRRTERAYGHFYREIPLPEGADPDAADASMQDGVLEITVPLTPSKKRGRRIDIQTS